MTNIDHLWDDVYEFLSEAKAITWDGCHKIYLAMDDDEVEKFIGYDYDMTPVVDTQNALETLKTWFDESCGLRFVSAVKSVPSGEDANKGFTSLIPQFADEEDEEEDEEDW